MNAIWLLNDSFSIKVEYNEYAPRIPLVHQYYPYEIAISWARGDFKKFWMPVK